MEWDSERAQAVFEALDGAFPADGIVVAVAAVDSGSSGPAFAVTEGLPEDARFEIGSITKTMTATLLASLVGDGVLALGDEIGRWLDAGPHGNITLERLGQMWQFALGRIGEPGPVSVSCRSQPDGVGALITFSGSKSPLSLLVQFTASGQIVMLRAIAPEEALPW